MSIDQEELFSGNLHHRPWFFPPFFVWRRAAGGRAGQLQRQIPSLKRPYKGTAVCDDFGKFLLGENMFSHAPRDAASRRSEAGDDAVAVRLVLASCWSPWKLLIGPYRVTNAAFVAPRRHRSPPFRSQHALCGRISTLESQCISAKKIWLIVGTTKSWPGLLQLVLIRPDH